MNEKPNIDDLYSVQLDSWEEFLSGILKSQSDSSHAGLSMITQNSDNLMIRMLHYTQQQIDICILMEQQFLHIFFNFLKESDPSHGVFQSSGVDAVEQILQNWNDTAEKSIEAHTDYYRLIFPWSDGSEPDAKPVPAPDPVVTSSETPRAA